MSCAAKYVNLQSNVFWVSDSGISTVLPVVHSVRDLLEYFECI